MGDRKLDVNGPDVEAQQSNLASENKEEVNVKKDLDGTDEIASKGTDQTANRKEVLDQDNVNYSEVDAPATSDDIKSNKQSEVSTEEKLTEPIELQKEKEKHLDIKDSVTKSMVNEDIAVNKIANNKLVKKDTNKKKKKKKKKS